ncbi:MAG: phospholipid carrier-dependent glycosyltransferase [Chloroflexaceae bacterium]|nr:phospholipid carrier-dependent glycosyltransferase [Chloroflexaceae bacterium]
MLLWATDPFLVAFSRIVHVDALLTSFMTLSLLSALLAFRTLDPPAAAPEALTRQTPPALDWPMLVVSAVAGGLALLTKSPAILLLPMIGVLALFAMIQLWPAISHFRQLALISSSVLIWLSIAAVLWLALWPAAWVDPAGALARVVMQAQYEGGSPHGWGNFFLGQPVNDPGPLFYPVALAFRLTPWASVGLLAALVATLWRRPKDRQRRLLFVLVGYVGCFLLVFTMAPKKFDRYLLPIVPSLQIIAAIGLVVAWRWAARRWSLRPAHQLMLTGVGTAVLLLNLACYHPYAMAYYNPLLGGGSAAANVIPVGWGEGLDQAGAFLQQQFNGCDYPVATWFVPVLQPYSCTPVVPLDWASEPGRVDYAVLYIDQLQRNNRAEITHQLSATQPPLHRVVIHGIPYALIYQLPPTANPPPPVDFGSLVRLYDYAVDDSMLRSDGVITVTTHWQARNQIERDYLMFVHVLDAQGERLGGVDVPPGGPRAPTRVWLPWQYSSWFHPVPLPNELPGWRLLALPGPVRRGERATLATGCACPGPCAGRWWQYALSAIACALMQCSVWTNGARCATITMGYCADNAPPLAG